MNQKEIGLLVLRLGLASVFLWFGFSQLTNGIAWVAWVPEWAVQLLHIPPAMIVLGNGLFEVIAGALLALGFFVRPVAVLLAIHTAIIVFEIGFTAIGVRDFGLLTGLIALALISQKN
ncbi:DoxX family protein [Patescibacteria group bacterium]|nr:MAG: DoxX family protein [Patescibacteria group bacterium]